MKLSIALRCTPILLALLPASCAGIKSATPISIEVLRESPQAADPGYTLSNGVPSLAERFEERPGLKLAIAQVAYIIQGRPELSFKSNIRGFGPIRTWDETTTTEVMTPASFALASALHATQQTEAALRGQGFDVISHEAVAATQAYQKHYGDWEPGYTMDDAGHTVVAPPPMNVKGASSLMDFGRLHMVWPDSSALQDMRAELGQDVLFLCLRFEANTMSGLASALQARAALNVVDPEFVGYGIGGYGHYVATLDALTERGGVEVPGFIARKDESSYRINWTPVFEDLGRIHASFAAGWANTMRSLVDGVAEN